MITKYWHFVLSMLLLQLTIVAQVTDSTRKDSVSVPVETAIPEPAPTEKKAPPLPPSEKPFIFKPTLGLGAGMFSFFGDLYTNNFQQPMTSRIGYELSISQPLNSHLSLSFYSLFGNLGANERQDHRNLNFESQIRLGGINLRYNFNTVTKGKKRYASPYLSIGIESFEFLSKTDLYDKNGARYYYWTDGSIRNIDQNSPNAANAIKLTRDYTYESDIRQLNFDKFGKYPERSWAIPFGAGILINMNKEMKFRLGTTLHYTFTDYIDGVTNKSIGSRKGNGRTDMFLMTSFSISYSLYKVEDESLDTLDESLYENIDMLAVDSSDYDKDGIPDIRDLCALTPDQAIVQDGGCPVDNDNDGVPDYMDKEENTAANAIVNPNDGKLMSDSAIMLQYLAYNDSTGEYAERVIRTKEENGTLMAASYYYKSYAIELGSFKKGVSSDTAGQLLSISDIHTFTDDDSTIFYLAGSYSNYIAAYKRQQLLSSEGYKQAKIVILQEGKLKPAEDLFTASNLPKKVKKSKPKETIVAKEGGVIGKDTLGKVTIGTKDTSAVKTTDTGIIPIVTAVDSTRSTLADSTVTAGNEEEGEEEEMPKSNQVVFRVQLGVYKRPLSKNVFKDVPGLVVIKTSDGMYRYISGSYDNFKDAAQQRVELYTKGFKEAFVTAYQHGKRVSNTSTNAPAELQKKGATPVNPKVKENLEEPSAPMSTVDKSLIVFKVQLGVFKYEPPDDVKGKLDKLKGVKKEKTTAGLDRYVFGETNDYNEIMKIKAEMIEKHDIQDAFIIAFFNDQYISLQEALELMK